MTDHVKYLSASLLLHGAAMFLVLWIAKSGFITEKKILVVDLSAITPGRPNEGGSLPGKPSAPGPRQSGPALSLPKQQLGSLREQAPLSETAVTPKSVPHSSVIEADGDQQPANAQAQYSTMISYETTGDEGAGSGVSAGAVTGRGDGPGLGTGTGHGLARGYAKSNYNYILVSIRRNLQYPDYARRKGLTGAAQFAFVIRQDGTIEDLSLKESSGYDILDRAAEKAIQQAAPFPQPPEPALLVVPINFRLN
jgi:TonB family protein